ncbi:butyrophilin-like protein 2 [Labeo rohita]|uniref:butyrophilin-like protein 2 n=1 Tax=Labeo rohita TaxID=84645 RepID=UPI0021E2D5FC|nr:butyrophilin-like protein 2 [Labeo rohita]
MESYEGRVNFSVDDLHNGNVSLTLRDVRSSQMGIYICEVSDEYRTVKEYIFLHISSVNFSLVAPTDPVYADPGADVVLPVHLSPETSAASMEIRWLKGTEFIYYYKKGGYRANDDYENRVSLFFQELDRGNLSLIWRNVQSSDSGEYTCTVIQNGCQKIGTIHLHVKGTSTSSMEGIPPLMERERGGAMGQELSSPNASSEVLQTVRTSESFISIEETTQTQDNPGGTMPNTQERQGRSSLTVQLQEQKEKEHHDQSEQQTEIQHKHQKGHKTQHQGIQGDGH